MTEEQNKNKKVSFDQKEFLVEFMTNNEDLRRGKFSNSFSKKDGQNLWNEAAAKLNSMEGPTKQWADWRKCWQDLSSRAKCKASKIRLHNKGTGGGTQCSEKLLPIEQKIVDLLCRTSLEGQRDTFESYVQNILVRYNEISISIQDVWVLTRHHVYFNPLAPKEIFLNDFQIL